MTFARKRLVPGFHRSRTVVRGGGTIARVGRQAIGSVFRLASPPSVRLPPVTDLESMVIKLGLASVSDAQLMAFLGSNADVAHQPPPRIHPDAMEMLLRGFPIRVQAAAGFSCTLLGAVEPPVWTEALNFGGTGSELELLDPTAGQQPFRFYRVRINP